MLILIIIVSILGYKNIRAGDPLPIFSSQDIILESVANDSSEPLDSDANKTNNIIHIQAAEPLQIPLDAVIIRFEARNPQTEVRARYVTVAASFDLESTDNTDLLITDDRLNQERLALLQKMLNDQPMSAGLVDMQTDDSDNRIDARNSKTRLLTSFSYAMKDSRIFDGVVLTDNPVAVNFRNFIVSSSGQDILRQYGFVNIEGYQNNVDDLFNPKSQSRTAVEQTEIVTESLGNGD